jgi:7-keto-8-aminopelargonate synthetase-like enzyme
MAPKEKAMTGLTIGIIDAIVIITFFSQFHTTIRILRLLCILRHNRWVLNLGSYNYLGYGSNDGPGEALVLEALEKYGASLCSHRSFAGNTADLILLEQMIAEFVGKDAAMVFGMGFATNSTVLSAVMVCFLNPAAW